MKFKAILFDLDGTLLDTLADISDSMNAALEKFGFPVHSYDDYRYFIGDSTNALAFRVIPEEHRDEATMKKCLDEMDAQYHERWQRNTKIYPGIEEMLAGIDKLGLPKAVLSNKPDKFVQITVNHFFEKFSFDVVRGVSASLARKPDPTGALQIARELNIEPKDFLYLGDTNTDMITAIAAGMYPVGATWGFRDAAELLEYGAEALVEKAGDVIKILTE
ncbi:MAG: HAD family hydrolase [Planctomycetes bacterium]|nr:HAD family hydrolase [Planctomycetota bacterium]